MSLVFEQSHLVLILILIFHEIILFFFLSSQNRPYPVQNIRFSEILLFSSWPEELWKWWLKTKPQCLGAGRLWAGRHTRTLSHMKRGGFPAAASPCSAPSHGSTSAGALLVGMKPIPLAAPSTHTVLTQAMAKNTQANTCSWHL